MLQLQQILLVVIGLLLYLLEAETTTTIRWHSAGAPIDSPAAWLNDYLPCAHDLIVFPKYYPAVLPLPPQLSIGGFVLPREGGILLAEDATIELRAGVGLNPDCGNDKGRAYLKPPKTSKWFDPGSWSMQPDSSSSGSSSLMPELERVPCDDEHVVIPSNRGALAFDLENVQFLRLGQLILAGSSISRRYLQELLGRDLGQLLFHNAEAVFVEYYRGELCGCHKDFEKLIEPVCHNVEQQCPVPHCVAPLRPFGSCCLVCGATLTIPSEHCMEEDRKSLTSFISKTIAAEDLADELQFHVNYVGSSSQYGNHLQAIILERGSYSERSVKFMEHLSALRNQSNLLKQQSQQLMLHYAGHPYNPNVSFGSVLLILFCLVLVGFVALIMLAHFLPQHPYLNRLPQWLHDPRRWRWPHLDLRRLRRNLLFNRFDNAAQAERGRTGSAGSGVEDLAVIGYDAQSGVVRERAFNNPMFEQEQEQEQAAAASLAPSTVAQPQIQSHPIKMETGDLDLIDSVEGHELTEINLDSSEAESEIEEETKK
ncbi:GH10219 [Drosophila grimshawi]|uniref:Protein amnionless n=2 Tax=Drosophila grimshawi TaxID=7222 RepID=B4JBG4_DROGR|nr:GH10219 [Drosophila grimshawi]